MIICWLKENEQDGVMIKMVLSVFCFILCLSSVTSIMRPYIPVTLGNCDRFQNSRFFWNQVFYCLEQCACHIPADHDCCRLKENEHDKMVFMCFMFHVPLDSNIIKSVIASGRVSLWVSSISWDNEWCGMNLATVVVVYLVPLSILN